ncbi:chaplin family protein [Agromyces ramosus]|uniref:Chaplin domain-containing protein n=1 Tax=Agromyces ramosus TaxID=33879 RepID=A0ABU0R6J3_9MICO|nr:chaplin family protein [Agromyces ramosus]MDQ0893695.1 hypothetical protein [Agromyces ramosus]
MKRLAMRALYATLFAGGLTLLGAGVAHASDTSGDDGILSGTQAGISIELPVTPSGNAVSVIGDSSSSDATTEVSSGDDAEPVAVTSGDDGVGSGTQALVDVAVPVTVSGNAVSVIGDSSSEDATTVVAPADSSADAGTAETSGDDSLLGGTQGLVNVTAPVTLGGNAISVIGDSSSENATTVVKSGDSGGADSASTSGDDSILGGTQLLGNVNAPITLGGNAISIIGDSVSSDATTVVESGNGSGGGSSAETSGEHSILGGTQAVIVGNLPVTVGGNAVSGIGDSSTDGAMTGVVTGGSGGSEATTSGEDSILGGTQVLPSLGLPLTVGGNAISGIGDSTSTDAVRVVRPGTRGRFGDDGR